MENLSISHQSLMKRRFSVPETVMRKHNLQDLALRNQVADSIVPQTTSSSSNLENADDGRKSSPVHVCSWLDDDQKLMASSKRSVPRTRKRKSFRLLRKSSSSYCQYRYTMSGYGRQILGRRATKFRDPPPPPPQPLSDEATATENSDRTYSLEYSNDGNVELEAGCTRRGPSPHSRRLPEIREFPACPQRTAELIPIGCGESVKRSPSPTNCANALKNLTPTDFPLIVQSESVFHHPSQPGCFARRETHSISIEISPSCGESQRLETNNYFRTAVRIDRRVRGRGGNESQCECNPAAVLGREYEYDGGQKQRDVRAINEIEARREGAADRGLQRGTDSKNDDRTFVNESKARPEDTRRGSIRSNSDGEDCAVPVSILDCLAQKNGSQQLNIQVTVGKIGALENALLTPSRKDDTQHVLPPCSNDGAKPAASKGECNGKVALNYLFQKLGDSYPKPQSRLLLKEPTFVNYRSQQSHFGQYYSGLPKLSDMPVNLMYSKYNIPPTRPLAGERKPSSAFLPDAYVARKLDDAGEHSDSDISIADSLEDTQTKDRSESNPPSNRYCKYDERLARGDVDKLVQALRMQENTPSKRTVVNGVSYFLQFSNVENGNEGGGGENICQEVVDHHAPHMPNYLLEKLNRRSNSISKHSYCLGACKSREFVHKQIQTCFNVQESLRRKRRTRISERTLDKRIARILMTGLEMQEGPKAELLGSKPAVAGRVADESLTSGGQSSTVNEVEGIYWFHYSTDRAEKKDAGEDVPNSSSKYRYQKNKLKYFEQERKMRKPREGKQASRDDDHRSSGSTDVRKFVASYERRSPPKVRNGKPKVFGTRFCQKFEAIPEEMASAVNDHQRYDVNSNCVEQKYVSSCRGPKPNEVDDEKVSVGEGEPDRISKSNLETSVDGNSDTVECSGVISKADSNIGIANNSTASICIYCKETPIRFSPNLAVGGNNDSQYVEFTDRLSLPGANPTDSKADKECKVDSPVLDQLAGADGDRSSGKDLTEPKSKVGDPLPSSCDAEPALNSVENCEYKNDDQIKMGEKTEIEAEAAASEIGGPYDSVKSINAREKESQNRRDLLYSGNAKEELITLSRGWINFYLLKAGNVGADDGSNLNEDVERDASVASSEDAQQYMLHIQAVPQMHSASSVFTARQRTRTLPDLSQLLENLPPQRLDSRWHNVSSKMNSTSPEAGVESTRSTPELNHRVNNSWNSYGEYQNAGLDTTAARRATADKNENSLPLAKPSTSFRLDAEIDSNVRTDIDLQSASPNTGDAGPIYSATKLESEIMSRSENGDLAAASSFWSESTSVMNVRSTASSAATSGSNDSRSTASNEIGVSVVQTDDAVVVEDDDDDDAGRNVRNTIRSRKTQYNLRPQNNHSTSRQDCYPRSISVEGNNRKSGNKKNSTGTVDIEMRLLVKNRGYQDDNGNRTHSWKFTLTSDDSSNVNKNERSSSKSRYAFCTPNRNASNQNQTRIVKLSGCSETTSTSTSTCSSNERKRNKEAKFSAKYALSSYPLRSNDNLTVTGSSITPESKPKPPSMSERDLTRTRFLKYATNINKL